MPTTRPRYTITDTGPLRALLDDAQHRWPGVRDRKELLLRLAQAGHDSLRLDRAKAEERNRQVRQRAALSNLQRTVDWSAIRDDQAWT
jgi:hypothetical protein